MVAAMPLQNDARPNEKTVTLRDLRRVAFGLSAAIMIVMIAGAINDDSGSSTATAELDEISSKSFISITAGQSGSIAEGSTATTAVMTVATDSTPTGCSISSGHTDVDNDGNLPFAISATCAITVNDADDFDFENNVNSWTLTILANDASGADVETVAISVTDVEISITSNSANLAENAADDDAVLTMASTGDDADANGWSITGGNTNGDGDGNLPFAINSGTGAITVNDAGDLDRETTASYTLEISISDGTGNAVTEDVVITITDVDDNDPVFADETASANVDEGTQSVGTYTGTDADSGDTLVYAIVDSDDAAASVDHDLFTINSGTGALTFSAAPDFENQGCGAGNNDEVCVVVISVSDGSGTTDTMTITATVVDTNDNSPVFTAGDAATVTPNEEQQTIATYGATDADANTNIVYSISGGQDSALFTVNTGSGALTFTNAPDFENPGCGANTDSNACTVILTATDGTNDDTITVTVNIQDTNDNSPVFSDGDADAVTVNEGTTTVATYTATDGDAGSSLTYTIVAAGTDANSVDHDLFSIDASSGALAFANAPDFENQGCGADNNDEICVVILSVSDTSTTDTITVTVTVANLNDNSPVFTAGDTATATPNEEQQTIATYGATDADAGTTIAYSISGGQDSGLFTVDTGTGALTFTNAPDF